MSEEKKNWCITITAILTMLTVLVAYRLMMK